MKFSQAEKYNVTTKEIKFCTGENIRIYQVTVLLTPLERDSSALFWHISIEGSFRRQQRSPLPINRFSDIAHSELKSNIYSPHRT